MQTDFDDRVDILPVADPNIFSQTQRISLAQTELQLAASNPRMHNQYEVYRNMYEALGVKDIDLILKPKPQMVPKDPSLEHIDALGGMPFRAFPGQDHRAHITAHLNFMATNLASSAPMMTAAVEKNCLEHISLMAQEQIELEFREEMQQMKQMQMQAQQNPQMMQQNPQMQQQMQLTQQKIEARKAILIAEMMEDFKKQAERFGTDTRWGMVTKVNLSKRPFKIEIDENKNVFAETVIIATGASAKWLGIEDEKRLNGR